MTNIAITKYGSEDSTAQTPGPPVQGPVTGQVTAQVPEHHLYTLYNQLLLNTLYYVGV